MLICVIVLSGDSREISYGHVDQRRGIWEEPGDEGGKFDGIFKLVTRDLLVRDIKRVGTGPYGQQL